MNEAQRFLRYVVPGVVFLVEFFLLARFCTPCGRSFQNEVFKTLGGIDGAFLVLVFSAGFGYLLAQAYHVVTHVIRYLARRFFQSNLRHGKFLRALERDRSLFLRNQQGQRHAICNRLTARGEWRVMDGLWWRIEPRDVRESLIARADNMMNLKHAADAGLTACITAIIFFLVCYWGRLSEWKAALGIAFLLVLHVPHWIILGREAPRLVEHLLNNFFFAKVSSPVVVAVTDDDLVKSDCV